MGIVFKSGLYLSRDSNRYVIFQILGLIVPPLPPRPAADPQAAESKSRKHLGSTSRAIMGDDFTNDAHHLERYLHQMVSNIHTTKILTRSEIVRFY